MSSYEIEIKNVSMKYLTDKSESTALSNISFNINKGEFISLLGPSGCGKTTLLRIIADLLQPTEGSITIAGKEPKVSRLEHKYGIVFQNPVLYEWRTIKKNVMLPLELLKVDKAERSRKVDELLELVGLSKFKNHYPWQLSGGMQQRVAIARALATEPEILLMDEPFSALDEFSRERLNDELLQIWSKTKTTVVFVTHSIAEAAYLSDRVCVLSPHPGRLSAIVDVDLPRPRTSEIRSTSQFFDLTTKIRNSFEEV